MGAMLAAEIGIRPLSQVEIYPNACARMTTKPHRRALCRERRAAESSTADMSCPGTRLTLKTHHAFSAS